MDIKIIVATHKAYRMPHDSIYLPLQVGKAGREDIGLQGDDTGENISDKNAYFCELTGLYWAWKNLDADYIGLCHYRRYFTAKRRAPKSENEKFEAVLSRAEAERLLSRADILLPRPRRYYIETLGSHYKHTMHAEPLDEVEKIIAERHPAYTAELRMLDKRTAGHMFNMFVMKKEVLDGYLAWLFDILFELEVRIPPTRYDPFHARYLGRISELLLDVYIRTNRLSYAETPVMDIEGVPWLKKGSAFLRAKFLGKKYEKSF